jgi:hypothetical protein
MRFLATIGALAIVFGIGCAAFFFGGYYSVAGTAEDPAAVTWALTKVRTASVNRHATDSPPTGFGAPGVMWLKYSEGLHPDPPDLKKVAGDRSPGQLFWVIKNGINMTGMPSFELAGIKDDEIWSIAAFVKKLPAVSEADYKSWTASAEPKR